LSLLSISYGHNKNTGQQKALKTKIFVHVSQDKNNQCANFQLKRSELKVTECQKLSENDAYFA